MSRFRKLSHTLWHHQYHIVWAPKYRFRILTGNIAVEAGRCIHAFTEQQKCEIIELTIQLDHVHLLVMIPPKIAVSNYVGTVKGRTAIPLAQKRARNNFPVWHQEKKERHTEQNKFDF